MIKYYYKAVDDSGQLVKGNLEAEEEKAVAARLHASGYIPVQIKPHGFLQRGWRLDFSGKLLPDFKNVSSKDILFFTQDLRALLEAGLPVDRALIMLHDTAENEKLKDIIQGVIKSVQGGNALSEAMSKYPKAFSSLYINMIKAGESGGILPEVLGRLGDFLENIQKVKDYVNSALIYPVFLLLVGGVSIIIMLTFVIPKFSVIFADMGQAIPLSTRVLLGLSDFVRSYWWVFTAMAGLGIFLGRQYANTDKGRLQIDDLKIRLPIWGDLIKSVEMARFSRTLGTLIRSGVPILQGLNLVRVIITNRVVADSVEKVHDRVKEGENLTVPLNQSGVFPTLAIQMISVGEETGNLEAMLLRVAQYYEDRVENKIKRLISLLEPVLILSMGLVIGFIVISMLMAVFSINEVGF
ncbi:MAG: type II secretion system F family protein [Desulfobacterales bacterium]|nr:type II secretion system F family protein [Desulfobacterales bacterium]